MNFVLNDPHINDNLPLNESSGRNSSLEKTSGFSSEEIFFRTSLIEVSQSDNQDLPTSVLFSESANNPINNPISNSVSDPVDTSISYTAKFANYVTETFTDFVNWLKSIENAVSGAYHEWLNQYKYDTYQLYFDLKSQSDFAAIQPVTLVEDNKGEEQSIGSGVNLISFLDKISKDTILSGKDFVFLLKKIKDKGSHQALPRINDALVILNRRANKDAPLTYEMWCDLSMTLNLAVTDYKKKCERDNRTLQKEWEPYKQLIELKYIQCLDKKLEKLSSVSLKQELSQASVEANISQEIIYLADSKSTSTLSDTGSAEEVDNKVSEEKDAHEKVIDLDINAKKSALTKPTSVLTEQDELDAWQQAINSEEVLDFYKKTEQSTLKLTDAINRQEYVLKLIKDVRDISKAASLNLARDLAIPHIMKRNEGRDTPGYSRAWSISSSAGIQGGIPGIIIGGFAKGTTIYQGKNAVDEENHYGESRVASIGGSAGPVLLQAFGLVDISQSTSITTSEGTHKQWTDGKNNAAEQFSVHINDPLESHGDLTPYLSRRRAWTPESLSDRMNLSFRNFVLDRLEGHEVFKVDNLNVKYEKTKKEREARLTLLASGLEQNIFYNKDVDVEKDGKNFHHIYGLGKEKLEQLKEFQRLHVISGLKEQMSTKIAKIKLIRDKERERINENSLLPHARKSKLIRRHMYVSDSSIKKIEKDFLIDKLKFELGVFNEESAEFIAKRNRIEEIYLTEKLRRIKKYFTNDVQAAAGNSSKEDSLYKELNIHLDLERTFINHQADKKIVELKAEIENLEHQKQSNIDSKIAQSIQEEIARVEAGISFAQIERNLDIDELNRNHILEEKWIKTALAIEDLSRECERELNKEITRLSEAQLLNPVTGVNAENAINKIYEEKIKEKEQGLKWSILYEEGYFMLPRAEFADWTPEAEASIEFIALPNDLNKNVSETPLTVTSGNLNATAMVGIPNSGFGLGVAVDGGWEKTEAFSKRHTPRIESMMNLLKSPEQRKSDRLDVREMSVKVEKIILDGWTEETARTRLTLFGDKVLEMSRRTESEFRRFLENEKCDHAKIVELLLLREKHISKEDYWKILNDNNLVEVVRENKFNENRCYNYLLKDYDFFMNLERKLAGLGNKAQETKEFKNINLMLNKLYKRYGAENRDQFLTHSKQFGENLFAVVCIDGKGEQEAAYHEVTLETRGAQIGEESGTGDISEAESQVRVIDEAKPTLFDQGEKIAPSIQIPPLGKKIQKLVQALYAAMSVESASAAKIREDITSKTEEVKAKIELKAGFTKIIKLGVNRTVEVSVRNHSHPSILRSGDYIDLIIKGGSSLGWEEINAIAGELQQNSLTEQFGKQFAAMQHSFGDQAMKLAGDMAVKMRWIKLDEHKDFDLGFKRAYTRVLLSAGIANPLPEAPIPLGPVTVPLGLNFSLSGSRCMAELYGSDSVSFYAFQYNVARTEGFIDKETGVVKKGSYWEQNVEKDQRSSLEALFSNYAREQIQERPGLVGVRRACNLIDDIISKSSVKTAEVKKDELDLLKGEFKTLSKAKLILDKKMQAATGYKKGDRQIFQQWETIGPNINKLRELINTAENQLTSEAADHIEKHRIEIMNACNNIITTCGDGKKNIVTAAKEMASILDGMVGRKSILTKIFRKVDSTLGTELLPTFNAMTGTNLLREMEAITHSVVNNEALNRKDKEENVRSYKTYTAKYIYARDQLLHATVVFELQQNIDLLHEVLGKLNADIDKYNAADPARQKLQLKFDEAADVLGYANAELNTLLGFSLKGLSAGSYESCKQKFRDFLQHYAPHCDERKANSDLYKAHGSKQSMPNAKIEEGVNIGTKTLGPDLSWDRSESWPENVTSDSNDNSGEQVDINSDILRNAIVSSEFPHGDPDII